MEEKDKLIWKIQRWFLWEAKHLHRDIIKGIKNLWKWLPLVWKDRDWDHHFIFETLKFKIQNTAKYIKDKDRYVGAERDYEVMMTCVRLIQKIQDEEYDGEWTDYLNEKMIFKKEESGDMSILEFETISENFQSYYNKYPLVYKRALIASRGSKWPYTDISDETISMWMCHYNHTRAKRILFTLMERNIEKWWD
jgi:hypothetical protein